MALIEIQLVRGAANKKQRKTLTALGLKRIGDNKWVSDTAEIRAKIKRVSHLIQINNDPTASGQDQPAPQYDEEQDIAQMLSLAFGPNGITLERYSDIALKSGKTPDFKLLKEDAPRLLRGEVATGRLRIRRPKRKRLCRP